MILGSDLLFSRTLPGCVMSPAVAVDAGSPRSMQRQPAGVAVACGHSGGGGSSNGGHNGAAAGGGGGSGRVKSEPVLYFGE